MWNNLWIEQPGFLRSVEATLRTAPNRLNENTSHPRIPQRNREDRWKIPKVGVVNNSLFRLYHLERWSWVCKFVRDHARSVVPLILRRSDEYVTRIAIPSIVFYQVDHPLTRAGENPRVTESPDCTFHHLGRTLTGQDLTYLWTPVSDLRAVVSVSRSVDPTSLLGPP